MPRHIFETITLPLPALKDKLGYSVRGLSTAAAQERTGTNGGSLIDTLNPLTIPAMNISENKERFDVTIAAPGNCISFGRKE